MTIKIACERFIFNIAAINAKCDADMAALDANREAALAAHRAHIRIGARREIDRAIILADRTEHYRTARY
jgi:hypothetical protein